MMNQTAQPAPQTDSAQRTNISLKLPVMIVGLLFVAFTIYTFISIRVSQGSTADALQEELTAQVAAQADLIRITLNEPRIVAINLASAAEAARYQEDEILQVIENTLNRNETLIGAAIAYEPGQFRFDREFFAPSYRRTTEGRLVFNQLGNVGFGYLFQNWYITAKEQNATVLSAPYVDYSGGDVWLVTWSAPFYDEKSGNFKGVATVDIPISQIQEIVAPIEVGEDGYVFLIDSNGTILAITEGAGEYTPMIDKITLDAFEPNTINWDVLMANMISGQTGYMEATDVRGNPLYVAYTPVGLDTGWSLAIAYQREEVIQFTARLQTSLILYSVLASIVFGVIIYFFTRTITIPLNKLTTIATQIASEDPERIKDQLAEPIRIETQDELEDLAIAFNKMAFNLKQLLENLEDKVTERTADLERLATDLRTVSDLARDITVIRDLDTLLNVSASLIRERLGYYHVAIFLVDERREYAVLRAASSIAAEQMLAVRYKLKIGRTGLVGNVTQTGQAYVALDTGADAVHFENPYLPDTRSEIVLPLRSRSMTIGALDIQAKTPNAFGEQDAQTLQILADQLAAAIENAQLVQQVENTLDELSKASSEATRQTWQKTIDERRLPAFEYDGLQIRPVPQNLPADLMSQLQQGQPVVIDGREAFRPNTLLIPLISLNQIIGVIGLEHENASQPWSDEEIAIASAAANRAALTLENARLLDESIKLASKQRAIFESTSRIGSAISIENILQTTVEELERVLRDPEITLQLTNVTERKNAS